MQYSAKKKMASLQLPPEQYTWILKWCWTAENVVREQKEWRN